MPYTYAKNVIASRSKEDLLNRLRISRDNIHKSSWLTYIQARCLWIVAPVCDNNMFPAVLLLLLFIFPGLYIVLLLKHSQIIKYNDLGIIQALLVFTSSYYLIIKNFMRVLLLCVDMEYLHKNKWSLSKRKTEEEINNEKNSSV